MHHVGHDRNVLVMTGVQSSRKCHVVELSENQLPLDVVTIAFGSTSMFFFLVMYEKKIFIWKTLKKNLQRAPLFVNVCSVFDRE